MKRNSLLWLLGAALVLRGAFALSALFSPGGTRLLRPDSELYLAGMRQMADAGRLDILERAPGFAAFTFPLWQAFHSYAALVVFFVLISVATLYILYLAVKEYADDSAALVATGFGAFHLTLIANAPLLLSDTLFFFWATLEFYFLLRFWKRKTLKCALLAGLAAGIGALVRPINLFHILPLAFLFFITGKIQWKQRFAAPLLAVAAFAFVVVPWMSFNASRGAGFTIDTNTGAMLHQNGAMLQAEVRHTSFEQEKFRLLQWENAVFRDRRRFPDAASREKFRLNEYRKMVCAYPAVALKQQLCNFAVLLPDAPTALETLGVFTPNRGTMGILAKEGVISAVRHYFGERAWTLFFISPFLLVALIVLVYALCRLVASMRHFSVFCREGLLFAGFALYYLWLPGAIVAPRYQIPALPVFFLLAALWATRKKNSDKA
ncbi:MAG: glycosyltransferase family 39 protein [Victivallaceae bacterium]|nr:glycosyltransferase family 39 protein [Victivallaceae bacterium]